MIDTKLNWPLKLLAIIALLVSSLTAFGRTDYTLTLINKSDKSACLAPASQGIADHLFVPTELSGNNGNNWSSACAQVGGIAASPGKTVSKKKSFASDGHYIAMNVYEIDTSKLGVYKIACEKLVYKTHDAVTAQTGNTYRLGRCTMKNTWYTPNRDTVRKMEVTLNN